jgi:glutathione synthase/RimK-type ligase-like ATP-grasp enzyme
VLPTLAALDIDARAVVWSDSAVRWSEFDLVVVRSTWDYSRGRRDEFLAWAERVGSQTQLRNASDVLRWNTHKGYLLQLEERGVPTVPTAFLAQGDRVDLGALVTDRGWGDVVIKPCVGGGARGAVLVPARAASSRQAEFEALLADGDTMVQPFLSAVATRGEVSIVSMGGAYSHAVRKVPAKGDWRVQESLGGRTQAWGPPPDVVALAEWVLEVTGHDYLYARVDLLPDDDGTWQVTEVEVTEPSLYLGVGDGAADRFAAAITAALPVAADTRLT